jgi:class 3 adenylate cyclase
MMTTADIRKEVTDIFKTDWKKREGQKVPEPNNIALGNDAVTLKATVMYADLSESTGLVDGYKDFYAAEIYKAFLSATCNIIKDNGGTIVAFDGDRVMAVFFSDTMNTSAVKAALKINYAVNDILNPAIIAQYPNTTYRISHAIGIDVSDLFVAKTGIWGNNDLVWVGKAANYAAKLCSLRESGYRTYITKAVYNSLHETAKVGGQNKQPMWEERNWTEKNMTIYRSNWQWSF